MVKAKDLENLMENFYKLNIKMGKRVVAAKFMEMGYCKATAYEKIKKLEQGSLKRKVGSGRIAQVGTPRNIQKIKAIFNKRLDCSQRNIAKKFNCAQSTISKILKHKTDIRA